MTRPTRPDAESNPIRAAGPTQIEPVDLSPMTFERVEWHGRQLAMTPPLEIQPTLDEDSGQLYVLTDEELDIHVFAPTREQAVDELAEQLLFLWDAYARETPERLTAKARQLGQNLRRRIREITLAAPSEGR
jgi:hypothetical protein